MNKEIRDAYSFIHFMETEGYGKRGAQYLIELKHKVREWGRRPVRHIFGVDDYGGCIELYDAPNWCETEQDVIEWFEECEWIHINSPYDCTGKVFTRWFKPVYRQGKWMVYHAVGIDC